MFDKRKESKTPNPLQQFRLEKKKKDVKAEAPFSVFSASSAPLLHHIPWVRDQFFFFACFPSVPLKGGDEVVLFFFLLAP